MQMKHILKSNLNKTYIIALLLTLLVGFAIPIPVIVIIIIIVVIVADHSLAWWSSSLHRLLAFILPLALAASALGLGGLS